MIILGDGEEMCRTFGNEYEMFFFVFLWLCLVRVFSVVVKMW